MQLFKNRIKFLSTLVFLYIILFEFVIPANKYFPKPSIIFDSFSDLFSDYNLISNLFLTTLIVLFALFFSYLIIYFLRGQVITFIEHFSNIIEILNVLRYIPVFFVPIVLIFIFGANFITELIFVFLIAIIFFFYNMSNLQKKVSRAYIDSAKSLGVEQLKIYKDVYWKCMEPALTKSIRKLNIYLWSAALLFEYIAGFFGLGSVYFQGFMYKDISAVFALTIIVFLLIAVVDWLIYLIETRTIFWSSD